MTNPARAPLLILGLLYAGFLGCIAWSAGELPDHMASHFDISGQPNGWMSRSAYLTCMLVAGGLAPLLIVGASYLSRWMPVGLINLPNREYWLASERREETCAYLLRHSLWMACLVLGLMTGIHLLVVEANRGAQPAISNPIIFTLLVCFLAGMIAWIKTLVRHFQKPRLTTR